MALFARSRNMFVSGRVSEDCREVSGMHYRNGKVFEAAMFGVPDDKWGEAVHAVVVPRGDVTAEDLLEHCKQHIAGYKLPKQIDLRDEPLPKSGPGKVLKRELRQPFWAGHDAQV